MALPAIAQTTALQLPTTPQTNGNRDLPAWSNPTPAGARILVLVAVNANQNDGIGVSVIDGAGGAAYSLRGTAVRQATGHDSMVLREFQLLAAAAGRPSPRVVFTGITTGVYIWTKAFAIVSDDSAIFEDPDVPVTPFVGADAAFTIGPLGPTARAEGLWIGASATPNIQVTSLAAGSDFTQTDSGGSGGSGDSAKATALIARKSQSAIGTAQMDVEVAGATVRQHAGLLIFIPGTGTGGGGGGGGGGGTGAPLSFPLGPPDMTGAITIDDTTPAAVFNPTLTNGKKYIFNFPQQRSRGIRAIGGNHIYIPKLILKAGARDSELIKYGGGDVGRILHIDTCLLDPNGFECDGLQTSQPCSGRHLQIRTMLVMPLIGSTDPVLPDFPNGVHADLIQASGGIGDVYIQDLVSYTTYQGIQMQKEAKLGPGASFAIQSISRSGTTVTVNATGHGLLTGDFVSIIGTSQSGFHGGHKVTGRTTNTFTYELAITPAATTATGGTGQQMSFAYDVGSLKVLRWHMIGLDNLSGDPAQALGMLRIGARTAPVNNSHPNEDATRITDEAWSGVAEFTNVWMTPPPGMDPAQFVKPDSDAGHWSVIRADKIGTAPVTVGWSNWPKVTGRISVGTPPGGEFVIMSGGVPVATQAPTPPPPGTPAPTNTRLPVIAPPDPAAGMLLTVADLGAWNDVDSATNWTVKFMRRQGIAGSFTTMQTHANLTGAQALADTYQTADPADVGYQYRVQLIADNGTPSTAINSDPTSVIVDPYAVEISAVVE